MFGSWDRTLFPFPFTRIVFFYAEPIFIAADASDTDVEDARAGLTYQLNRMHERARGYFSRRKEGVLPIA
jgi:lysophospholipid acyltransferase (LPLAT)-like uncharacterized protein